MIMYLRLNRGENGNLSVDTAIFNSFSYYKMELIKTTLLVKCKLRAGIIMRLSQKTNIELEGGYEFHWLVLTFYEFAMWVCPDLEIMTLNDYKLVWLNPSTRQNNICFNVWNYIYLLKFFHVKYSYHLCIFLCTTNVVLII